MSDIDLATLHKTRLEEKVNYKLSWWTNTKNNVKLMQRDGCETKSASTKQYNCHKKKPVVKSSSAGNSKSTSLNKKVIGGSDNDDKREEIVNNKKDVAAKKALNKSCDIDNYYEKPMKNKYESLEFDDLSDDGYFSSETRRRRSGTWP